VENLGVAPIADRLRDFGTTVFAEMSALALRTESVNLGQGFPDTDGPPEMIEAAVDALRRGDNQYPPGPGIPALRQAIARHQQRFYGLELNADGEILVTAGATEALTAAILALCDPGDEVVVFEPYYDSYAAAIAMAGAVRRVVPLRAPEWSFDPGWSCSTPRTTPQARCFPERSWRWSPTPAYVTTCWRSPTRSTNT
jgi:N-succinyldiaminopimelate aminotransferase